jgi:hypothetical protein
MKRLIVSSTLLVALCMPAMVQGGNNMGGNNMGGNNNNMGGNNGGNHLHGVPGPIAGAGLPIIAVGCGLYWLIRRRKRNSRLNSR